MSVAGVLAAHPAFAQDATWSGATPDYNLNTNWNPNVVPTGTATFSNTGNSTVDITASSNINHVLFSTNAQGYTVNNATASTYNINGIGTQGLTNDSLINQLLVNRGTLNFNNAASISGGAGMVVNNANALNFNNTSSAGTNSTTINTYGGDGPFLSTGTAATTNFNNSSTSGSANVTNTGGGGGNFLSSGGESTTNFNDSSTVGSSAITNTGGNGGGGLSSGGAAVVNFNNALGANGATSITNTGGDAAASLSAGGAATVNFNAGTFGTSTPITNSGGDSGNAGLGGIATLNFNNTGTSAGNAIINNTGGDADANSPGSAAIVNFNTGTSAGSATITNTGGTGGITTSVASTNFSGDATAGDASITNNVGGLTTFIGSSTAGASTISNNGGTTTFSNPGAAVTPASAGSATITNTNGGATSFFNDTSSSGATITNGGTGLGIGTTTFSNTSQQGFNTGITNNDGGTTLFQDTSSTTGIIINNDGGATRFQDSSNADSSFIVTNNDGGTTYFQDTSTASSNIFIRNNAGGAVDISGLTNGGITLETITGEGNVFLGANTLTTGAGDGAEISGVISDGGETAGVGGSLVKESTGVLTLSGQNTYTGTTSINAGTLRLAGGSVTSDTTVGVNGTLTGFGAIGNNSTNNLVNNGIIDAGDGTTSLPDEIPNSSIFVTGDFTNEVGSTIVSRVEGNGFFIADSNAIINGGNIIINGGTLQANVSSSDVNGFGPNGFGMETRALIAGTLNGTVSGLDTDFTTLDDSNVPTYLDASIDNTTSPDAVFLLLQRNSTNFSGGVSGLSFNQRGVAGVLDGNAATANPDFFNLFDSALLSSDPNRALEVISGDAFTALPFASQQAALRFNDRMRTHVTQGDASEERLALRPSLRMAYTGDHYRSLFAQNDESGVMVSPAGSTPGSAYDAEATRSSVWATIARASDDADSDGNGPGFDARATEYQVGYDRRVGANSVVGISLGKSDGTVDISDRNAEADIDTTSIGLYAKGDSRSFYWNGAISYNRHNIDGERQVAGNSLSSDYDARTIALAGEVGKRFGKGKYSIEPNISLKLNSTRQEDFEEDGGIGALNVNGEKYNTRRVGLGVRVVSRDVNARIRPHLFVGYEREFGDDQVELNNQINGLNGTFGVRGTDLGKNIFTARLGADARLGERFSLIGEIGASKRSNQDSQYIYGGVKYGF